jgi:hypothetical protein
MIRNFILGQKTKWVLFQGGGGPLLARLLPGLPALPQDPPQYDDVTGHRGPFRQPRALPQVGDKFAFRLQEMILKHGKASVFRIRMQALANSGSGFYKKNVNDILSWDRNSNIFAKKTCYKVQTTSKSSVPDQ